MMSNANDSGLLVDTGWLQAHLDDPDVRILDCTTYMTPQPVGPSRIESGRPDWMKAHIPGAQHVDMVEDLSDPMGRFPYTLPSESQIEALMSRLGIDNRHRIVLYGARHPMVVTRAWWVLRTLGHEAVSLLDGGWEAWVGEGRPTSRAVATPAPAQYRAKRISSRLADADAVDLAIRSGSPILLNALSPEQFRGTGGAHYGRPGRIPGSLSLPARDCIDPSSGRWRSPHELLGLMGDAGLSKADDAVIVYCGGGIAATATGFALELAGCTQVSVYDNSLLEWSADPARPMQTDGT